jgi:hypothetical protein
MYDVIQTHNFDKNTRNLANRVPSSMDIYFNLGIIRFFLIKIFHMTRYFKNIC